MNLSALFVLLALAPLSVPLAQHIEPNVHAFVDVTKGAAGDLFGWTAVALGDVDGDGVVDLAASAPFSDRPGASSSGSVFAFSGASGATLWSHAETLQSAILGFALETLDWNDDGILDVVAAAPWNTNGGRVWILSGESGAVLDVLGPLAPQDSFGASLATGGDFDGDGRDDLAVGSPRADTAAGPNTGRVDVFAKGTGALVASIEGARIDGELGIGLAFLGDVSAPPDGRDELVVGSRLATFFDGEAHVYAFAGGAAALQYTVGGVGMGANLLGDRIDAGKDLDRDGAPDFLVGDLFLDEVDVFSGRTGTRLYTLVGDADLGNFGTGHLIDDVNGDGHADLAIGAWGSDWGASDSGKVFVYSGRTGTVLKTITPTLTDRGLGCEVRGIGDFDGDGRGDLLVGAYGNGGAGLPLGRVLVYSGHLPGPTNLYGPGARSTDPHLTDTGGDPGAGPLPGSAYEPFNLSLDCTGFTAGHLYRIWGTRRHRVTPVLTQFGFTWTAGPTLFLFRGLHSGGPVELAPGGIVLPPDPLLSGLEFTAQGSCSGGGTRLSTAILQVLGS